MCTPSPGAPACPSFGVFNTSRATSNSSAWGAPASAPQHNYEFRYVPGVGASAGAPVSRSLPMVYAPTPVRAGSKQPDVSARVCSYIYIYFFLFFFFPPLTFVLPRR